MMKNRYSKKTATFFAVLTVLTFLVLPISADAAALVFDNADLLTSAEEESLARYAAEVGDAYDISVVILTEDGIGGVDPMLYAADFYDYGGYLPDGVIFLLEMKERDWVVVTSGNGEYAIGDSALRALEQNAVLYFSSGRYSKGFESYIEIVSDYYDAYINGTNDGYSGSYGYYNNGYDNKYSDRYEYYEGYPGNSGVGGMFYVVLFALSLLIAFLICRGIKSQLNTAVKKSTASLYFDKDRASLTLVRDRFLYSRVTKVARETEHHSSGGGHSGGGMKSFSGSSGRSHTGGGGKF